MRRAGSSGSSTGGGVKEFPERDNLRAALLRCLTQVIRLQVVRSAFVLWRRKLKAVF